MCETFSKAEVITGVTPPARFQAGLQPIEFCAQAKDLFVLSPQITALDEQIIRRG